MVVAAQRGNTGETFSTQLYMSPEESSKEDTRRTIHHIQSLHVGSAQRRHPLSEMYLPGLRMHANLREM